MEGHYKKFITSAFYYFEEYYKRENSEARFSADKKLFRWVIAQRREDRIDSALFCTGLWHDLLTLTDIHSGILSHSHVPVLPQV